VLGHLFQNFSRALVDGNEVDTPEGSAMFRLFVRPELAGSYKLTIVGRVQLTAPSLFVNWSCEFDVTSVPESVAGLGYVRAAANAQHFEAGGVSWFGVGENLCWFSPAGLDLFSLQEYMTNLTAYGGNYVRVWLTDSWDS